MSHIGMTKHVGASYQYYDLVIRNYASPDHESEIPLVFRQTQNTPIVPKGIDYEMSVVRFSMDSFNLPCMLFQPEIDQPDPDRGSYTLTLEFDDGLGTLTSGLAEHVQWVPQKKDIPAPSAPSANPHGLGTYSEYYFVNSYNYFCKLVNDTFKSAMTKLILLTGLPLITVEAPFITWSSDDNKATIYARESHFNSSSTAAHVNIYFNRPMFSLFNSFSYLKFGVQNPNRKYYQLLLDPFEGEKVINLPNFGIDMLIWSKQELSTIDQFTPVSSVVWTSNSLPIQPTQVSVPAVYLNGIQRDIGRTYSNFSNIITDISTDDGYKPSLLYLPQAELRMVSLKNDNPIHEFDMSIFWKDKVGFLHPMYLSPSSSCSCKVLFRRKRIAEIAP